MVVSSEMPADAPTLRISLECDAQAPSLARAAVTGFTKDSAIAHTNLATLILLVSELVSNAVVHANAPPASVIVLSARLLGQGTVRVEVTDQGSGFTAVPGEPAQREAGYGLYLVKEQASRWGVDRRRGTCVWFELAAVS